MPERIFPHDILLGTANPTKFELIRAYLAAFPVTLLSPQDLSITLDVAEDGQTPEQNAVKKACAYYAAAHVPTLATDAGLHIQKFPEHEQPGVYVRRIRRGHHKLTDEEIFTHYRTALERLGGDSPGLWTIALTLMLSEELVLTRTRLLHTTLTSTPSPVFIPGAPLSSLMLDPASGKYFSEMTDLERPDSLLIAEMFSELRRITHDRDTGHIT